MSSTPEASMTSATSSGSPRAARVKKILSGLARAYPKAECALVHTSALELLVATILSAQCTDVRVNLVTKELFKKYRSAQDFADADLRDLEALIRSTGFFRAKAKSLKGMAAMLVKDFGGEVPRTLAELVKLPGVARKTAGVVLGTAYGLAENVVVDTHVQRLAMRLGLTRSADVKNIEQDLMKVIPQGNWIRFSHQVIWHGRRVCFARKPQCATCTLAPFCPSAGLET